MGFAEKLRSARLKRTLNQKELAQASGVNHVQICRLENGHHQPTTTTLKKLCKALGLKPGDLADASELANATKRRRK
jgi:transcriptional regulator with XRE-family HTH domain